MSSHKQHEDLGKGQVLENILFCRINAGCISANNFFYNLMQILVLFRRIQSIELCTAHII